MPRVKMREHCPNMTDLQAKYCDLEAKAFKCRDEYGCDIACPFKRWFRFQENVDGGMCPSLAHEAAIRETISEEEAIKIIAAATKREIGDNYESMKAEYVRERWGNR